MRTSNRRGNLSKTSRHVVPNSGGGWSVRKSGSSRASRVFGKQGDAVDYARQLAGKNGGEIYIHHSDGTIREKNSYGNDPHPPTDKR
ncbi:MAG TPA: DUF2188 domain-containing protein [Bdellovibrionota bacterium]|nr:DUF2188 domain-containing protein [Bdellovibrionota bacterium]